VQGEPIKVGPYHGELTLIKNGHGGKSHALNAGIERSRGRLVVNIDSDVVLAPDAIRSIAEAFAWDPDLGAATGNIEVDWDVLESRDDEGHLIVDENGDIVPRDLRFGERWLAKWQFLEYLSSFSLGRKAQAETSTLYTLAGACSAFRRDVLMKGRLYSNRTVSEDTDLTFDLQRQRVKIGYIREARVFLEPVVSWDRLYSQRVRWARGQMEVCGLNEDMVGGGRFGALSRLALPQMLLYDHTLAFPRLIWAFLILLFPLFGYSWALIAKALIAMYIFYLLIEIVNALACNAVAHEDSRHRLEQSGLALLGLPAYRFVVFHFRFSGFLKTFKEDQQWTTPGPVDQTKVNLRAMRLRSIEFAAGFMAVGGVALVRSLRVLQAALAPLLLTIVFAVISSMDQFKRGQ
jgi:cellulose synthase/poly-beta-1,6-N-acetylglucosamine synthase-like glycosyltransferase